MVKVSMTCWGVTDDIDVMSPHVSSDAIDTNQSGPGHNSQPLQLQLPTFQNYGTINVRLYYQINQN